MYEDTLRTLKKQNKKNTRLKTKSLNKKSFLIFLKAKLSYKCKKNYP